MPLRNILLVMFIAVGSMGYGQTNTALSAHIDSMVVTDQFWRMLLRKIENKETDTLSLDIVNKHAREVDSINYLEEQHIFRQYGFPGFKLVGKQSSHNFWLLVQHADKQHDFQQLVLDSMKVHVDAYDAKGDDYAYLLDRVAVNTGQLQVYGTQMRLNKDSTSFEPKPVIDPDNLDKRRDSVRLPPMNIYVESMNNRYFGALGKQAK